MRTIVLKQGSRQVVTTEDGGHFASRLFVNDGQTAGYSHANHRTAEGAERWARRILGLDNIETVTVRITSDTPPDECGRRTWALAWEDPDNSFRPELGKDGQPVGHRRGQMYFGTQDDVLRAALPRLTTLASLASRHWVALLEVEG